MSLAEALTAAGESSPDRTALRFLVDGGTADEWSFGRLRGAAAACAGRFGELGLAAGDRVAFLLGSRPELVTSYLAVLGAGAVAVPMNTAYRPRELEHILTDAAPRLVVTERSRRDVLDGTSAATGSEILCVEDLLPDGPSEGPPDGHGDPVARAAVDADDPALILYTSGTTGRSKGAVLTHRNVLATMRSLRRAWSWSADDVLLLALPLFHTHGLVVGLHCALASGATTLVLPRFDADRVVDVLATGEPTLFFGVPTMYVRLLRALDEAEPTPDLGHMRLFCSGSAPLDPAVFDEFRRLTGHTILERYGMTETGMLLSNPYDGPRLAGTVGRELPGVQARVVDGEDRDVAEGEEGELLVRGENVFSGYWRRDRESDACFTIDTRGERWFRTGDLARRDPGNGYYTLLGRRHDLIISGGFNVYPREVEEVLMGLPGVREAAVVGRPHPEWGEQVVAFVVADPALDDETLTAGCAERLAPFKVPRRFHRIDELPRNSLGKVQKHLLPAQP